MLRTIGPSQAAEPSPYAAAIHPVQSEMGVFTFYVTEVANAENCNPQMPVTLTATGPGYETYSVLCLRGDRLAVQCDFGNCRSFR